MIGQIVPATLEHAIAMAPRVRVAEQEEVAASYGVPVVEAISRDLKRSLSAWTWLVDGEPACMFGLVQSGASLGSAFPWFLSTAVVEKHARYFARGCRAGLAEMLERHPRLVGMVDARYALSIRWLQWMGGSVGAPQPWGVTGALFRPFEFWGEPSLRSQLTVRQATVAELGNEPNLHDLVREYVLESGKSVHGEAVLDLAAYQRMEKAGLSRIIGAWRGPRLIGFLILMVTPVPHWGNQVIASTESYFVLASERHGGVGLKLRSVAERLAKEAGARGLYLSAPIGSRLEKVMARSGYRPSNTYFFKEFA